MRNLKKLLALVLAMVMAFSLMLTANAVKYDDYQDKDSITPGFQEAVNVLTGLKVMQGDEKGFRPSDKITRAEAAAVIYRAVTGDVDNRQNDLYKDYGTFTDVKSDDWFAGYVGYCQNAGYIKGTSATTFNPYGQVTGYEALAMILRAVGYGKNNEFTGASWQVNVAAMARQLGVTRNVTAAHMEQTLNMAAPREVVADLIFMTIATVPTVTSTPALSYNDKQSVTSEIFNPTLGQQVFGLFHDTTWQVIDAWGNPGYRWRNNGAWNGSLVTTITGGKGYMVPTNHPWYEATSNTTTVATIKAAPTWETTEQVHECDVAANVDFDGEEIFNLYVNQRTPLTTSYRVVATDTVTKVGGQGRLTKVYYEIENPWFTDNVDNHDNVVTMVDTMLALVTGKTDAKLDAAGHIITPATLEVTIYDGMDKTNVASTSANALSNRVISKPSTSKDNWDEYSKGDYILVNAYTNKVQNAAAFTAPATGVVGLLGNNTVRNTQVLLEEAAFTTNKVNTGRLTQDTNAWVLQKAESKQGKQTVTYWNANKHQVDGTDYNDQICLFLDRAGSVTNTTFTWFFDQYGNLIGIGDAHARSFGVITSVYAAISQGEDDTTGGVKAVANVKYTDGTTGVVEIDRFLMSWDDGKTLGTAPGTTAGTIYRETPGTDLTANPALPTGPADNSVVLKPVYDTVDHDPLSAFTADVTSVANHHPGTNNPAAWLYLAPSTASNTNAHFATTSSDAFQILYDNLFMFSVANDDSVVATEVAGRSTNVGLPNNTNPAFASLANNTAVAGQDSKLYKNLAYMDVVTTGPAHTYVYLDNDTEILVRLSATGRTINNYTLETLPGNVDILAGSEVDWADTDGDGRADYVYITGTMPSTITYGLFYYNGGEAVWTAASNSGTIAGYLNGEAKTITTTNRTLFNDIQSSRTYQGRLFAIQFVNDEAETLMYGKNNDGNVAGAGTDAYNQQLLNNGANLSGVKVAAPFYNATVTSATIATGWTSPSTLTGSAFAIGAANGNPYTLTTEAVYWNDNTDATTFAANTGANVRWSGVSAGNTVSVIHWNGTVTATTTYWLAPNAKIVGELEWLNIAGLECYVTIVYDAANANAITEIYIDRDPDITPETPNATAIGGASAVTMPNAATVAASQQALSDLIKTGMRDTVIYNPQASSPTGMAGLASSAPAANLLYFPYTGVAGTYTLAISNPAGIVVYREAATVSNNGLIAAGGDAHCFVIDWTGATNTGVGSALSTGVTYSFQILSASGAVVSNGSFSIG